MLKKVCYATVLTNTIIASDVYEMKVLSLEAARTAKPGMFFQIRIMRGEGLLLRRPISIADVSSNEITFIYRVIGKGTREMTKLKAEDEISLLGALGNGFFLEAKKPLLIGGGIGTAPLLYLAKSYQGKADILIGGRNKAEMFWPKIYADKVNELFVTTDDGSVGFKGFTVELLPEILKNNNYDMIIVCGPEIMMRAVYEIAKRNDIKCQVSLEKRMACGLGACLSCSIDTLNGRKKVCKDGPVFWAEEVFT